jgi:hypothetical protein
MDTTVGTMRELTMMEIAVVSGAFSWGQMGAHMLLGAGVGALAGAAAGGVGAGPGAGGSPARQDQYSVSG